MSEIANERNSDSGNSNNNKPNALCGWNFIVQLEKYIHEWRQSVRMTHTLSLDCCLMLHQTRQIATTSSVYAHVPDRTSFDHQLMAEIGDWFAVKEYIFVRVIC